MEMRCFGGGDANVEVRSAMMLRERPMPPGADDQLLMRCQSGDDMGKEAGLQGWGRVQAEEQAGW